MHFRKPHDRRVRGGSAIDRGAADQFASVHERCDEEKGDGVDFAGHAPRRLE